MNPFQRLEPGRLLAGSTLELLIKAYGAGGAASVAWGDAETLGGKVVAAINPIPILVTKLNHARYVVDHREEIRSAIDYLNQHAPSEPELQHAADQGTHTLDAISTTSAELRSTMDSLPFSPIDAVGHARNALQSMPDVESIRQLSDLADQMRPAMGQVDALIPVYYRGLSSFADNFASDEIVATVSVMSLAFVLALVLGHAIGFWVRRGRPGLIAQALQRLGARIYRPWYVEHLPVALTPDLYDVARERITRDIVTDPEASLGEADLKQLERHFRERSGP